MGTCDGYDPLDFWNPCVRASWGAFLPAFLALSLSLLAIPAPRPIRRILEPIRAPFRTYITLHEAEHIDITAVMGETGVDDEDAQNLVKAPRLVPVWRTFVFAFLGIVETLAWLTDGTFRLIDGKDDVWSGVCAVLVSSSWIYTIVRPIARPTATPPYDMFVLYISLLIGGAIQLGGILCDRVVIGVALPSVFSLIALTANVVVISTLLTVILSMPVAIPSNRVGKEEIGLSVSPEDYTSLWGWLSFSWVYPLIHRGRYNTLNENDVWNLSPTMQSRTIFVKFSFVTGSKLLWRIWKSNSLDLLLDFVLTIISVFLDYAGPFFLKRILDLIALENPTPKSRIRAYIYAFLAFVCLITRAQVDLQHLWFGRRAAARTRSELMASIYDKALKRKDLSGIVTKDAKKEASEEVSAYGKGAETKDQTKANKKKDKAKAAKAELKAGADIGKIVNLMAGDAFHVSLIIASIYYAYGAPLEIIIATVFLYKLLGWSTFAGFLVLAAAWPLNTYITRRSMRIYEGAVTARDKRMGVLNELIGAVKFIKFFAWEECWINRALDAREVEMEWIVKERLNAVMATLLWTTAPILVSIVSFTVYVLQGNQLDVATAFTAIVLFSMMKAPLDTIPSYIIQLVQVNIALNRIAVYLGEEEVDDQVSTLKKDQSTPTLPDGDDEGLGLENASFKWNEVNDVSPSDDSETEILNGAVGSVGADNVSEQSASDIPHRRFELKDITVRFPEGKLTVVTGPTASGKTALLLSVLGEMTLLSGRIVMSKEPSRIDEHGLMHGIAYAAQSPWLRHQSIKDNILFGYPYDVERYNAVISACALKPDLDMLEDGDETEIGAKGISLSGGQKARVALARAVYARTKYVLLDDPLSAVDSHTSRHLFERLLCGPLLSNRTVVLVTHHVELVLPGAFYLVRMLDGQIDTQGNVKDLRAQGVLEAIKRDSAVDAHEEEVTAAEVVAAQGDVDNTEMDNVVDAKKKARKLVNDEHRETGGVKWSIYKRYLKASSYWTWIILTALIVVVQLLGISQKLWIKTWGESYGNGNDTEEIQSLYTFGNLQSLMDGSYLPQNSQSGPHIGLFGIQWPDAAEHPLFYIGIYAAIGLVTGLSTVLSVTTQYTGALKASRLLFKQLLVTVVRATFRFHDTTPAGRLLNRFGKDVETIDSSLAGSLTSVNSSLAGFFASVITIAVVFPTFLIPAMFIGFAYYQIAVGYLNTGRDLRRMESNSRSPIYSDFGELLEGIVTVRAFSAEKRFLNNVHVKIDITTKMWYTFWMTNRWLLVNYDTLGAVSVFVTMLFSITYLASGAGLAGLCITSAMAFTNSVYWTCRNWTGLELDLNSVERIVEYLNVPQEPPSIIESNRVPAYWPSTSRNEALLQVEDLEIKYASDLPAVLHNISFALQAGERVGLLGRTGSGKSTLAMSVLRFVDPSSGRILIDGIDISKIGTHDLRSKLTFIPQDATLFSGTLRDNLDPFGEHDDVECYDVLRRVHLITDGSPDQSQMPTATSSRNPSRPPSITNGEHEDAFDSVSTTPTKVDSKSSINLDTKVSAGGINFSQGQRQLIAMARALLRRSSIIILDEATSSIDFATDSKVQATIRQEFGNSLILTIAHRLRTIIDYDRLIVLDKGQIMEFDTPWNLINTADGIFRTMCLKSGSFSELELAAKAKANLLA